MRITTEQFWERWQGPAIYTLPRAAELFLEERRRCYIQFDRMFALLMALQWAVGVGIALWISPLTWHGANARPHLHLWAAVVLGGLISSAPIMLALCCPGRPLTRQVIAVAQAAWSALLIHLTGGRIETHFHVFGSLALLAFYRDWRVLATASLVVALDHFARGMWWPRSVYGVSIQSPFRWIEHTIWVAFENIFLVYACVRGQREEWAICERHAELEYTNGLVEERVRQRSVELEQAQQRLSEASRQAGMAEVAASVLHNVGNVLNSVNFAAHQVSQRLHADRGASVEQVSHLIDQHAGQLAEFLTQDPRGKRLPGYLRGLAEVIQQENREALTELDGLVDGVEHIKRIIQVQQSLARTCNVDEPFQLVDVVEEAIRLLPRHLATRNIVWVQDFQEIPSLFTDKHKTLQILINLVKNAGEAAASAQGKPPRVEVRVGPSDAGWAYVEVADNGIGIAHENLDRIFGHGFTTKSHGHGFGLHSSALAAQQLGGRLSVHSEGLGQGAVFTLELPLSSPELESEGHELAWAY